MGTNSLIGIVRMDGSVDAVHCQYDGNWEVVGRLLFNHYTDAVKVKTLIGLGNVCELRPEIGEAHDINYGGKLLAEHPGAYQDYLQALNTSPFQRMTQFYDRDGGAPNQESRPFTWHLGNPKSVWYNYRYLYHEATGQWWATSTNEKWLYSGLRYGEAYGSIWYTLEDLDRCGLLDPSNYDEFEEDE